MGTIRGTIVVLFAAVFETNTAAAMSADLLVQIKQCQDIKEDAARLNCFDTVANKLNLKGGVSPLNSPNSTGGSSQSEKTIPVNLSDQDKFGFTDSEIKAKTQSLESAKQETQKIVAIVNVVRTLANGRLQVILDSGQIWEQVAPVADSWIAVGQTVTIRSGALGSFILKNERGMNYKVHRIK